MKNAFHSLRVTGLAVSALAGLSVPAHADTFNLGTIVVSATLVPTDAAKVGATVDVVTRKQLQNSANSTVADALQSVPGFTLRAKGGVGQQASFSLRGAGQAYVGVLIDGIDVTDPSGTQTSFDFGQLGTAGISRIEVLQGSQSALYGSSAIGGVISMTTRQPEKQGLHQYVWIEAGSRKTLNGSYSLTQKRGENGVALTLSHSGTSGYPVWVGAMANGKDNGFWSNRATASGSVTLANGVKLGFAGFVGADHGSFYPGTYYVGVDPSATARSKSDTGALRLYAQFDTGAVKNTISGQVFQIQRRYVITPAAIGADYAYTGQRAKISYKGDARLNARTRLIFGVDSSRDTYKQSGTYGSQVSARRLHGAFGELAYAVNDKLTLNGVFRRDIDSRFGGANTWRLAAAWSPRSDLTVRASAGTGFRAPSNYELFSPSGNTGLQPEKSRSFDLGVEKTFAGGRSLNVTLFHLTADNLIGFDSSSVACASPFGCYAQIPGKVRREGVELSGKTPIGKAMLKVDYTYTASWTSNSASSSTWAIPPRHVLSLDLSAPLSAKLTGGLTLIGAAVRPNLPNYAVLDARLSYKMNDSTEAYLRLANLTNAHYQLVQDYAQPGRSVYVGLRKSF